MRAGSGLLIFAFLSILVFGMVSPAWAAQLNWDAKTFDNAQIPKYVFQRTVFINYPDGGNIADALRGQSNTVSFSVDSSSADLSGLIDKLNINLSSLGSTSEVTSLKLDYSAQLTGRGTDTSIDYKITLVPTLDGFLIREYSQNSPALFDLAWRGMAVDGPITVPTEKYGDFEVNQPLSFIKAEYPDVASAISGTDAEGVLTMPLIDASDIGNQPLTNWHFLFDPTGIAAESSKFGFSGDKIVVSTFTMGESSIREGQQREKEFTASFTTDKTYDVRAVQSAASANVALAGYGSPDKVEGKEVIGVSPTAPSGSAQTSTGSFPVFIIYGMAGMAAVGAAGFFWWSNRKAKQESEYVQRGIDPKYLRSSSTSEASGGYHTTRGEAELATEEPSYTQHESVYGQGQALPKDEPQQDSKRGSMPKGWKPE